MLVPSVMPIVRIITIGMAMPITLRTLIMPTTLIMSRSGNNTSNTDNVDNADLVGITKKVAMDDNVSFASNTDERDTLIGMIMLSM